MNTVCRIAVCAVITLSIGFSAARSESKIEKKVEDNFKVNWTRISYTKTVSVSNPDAPEDQYRQVPQNQGQEVSERLSLSCQVEMLDPNFVLGISRAPTIEEMTDEKGGDIAIDAGSRSSFSMRYEPPRYRRRFVAPTKPAKWKTAVRSALKLPPSEGSQPRWVEEIEPSRMQIDIGVGTGEQAGEKIGRVKGFFYALVAESFEYVDIPFKKSDEWVRLTPDAEVQIAEASCDESRYRLQTKGRTEGRGIRGMISAEDYMPARVVTARQLIGPDDKPIRRNTGSRMLPFLQISGSSSSSGSVEGEIKNIRYVIAVNPTHREIPFVLENIPLPKP